MAGGALAVLGLTYLQFLEYTPLELFDAIEVKSELHDADQKYQALLMRIQTWYLYSIHVAEKDRYKIADIEKFMRDHLEQGGTHFIMEVTSEGIDQARILGIDFNIKLLTNITQDHLDYHKTFETYQQTKLSFMREGNAHKINPQDFRNEPINFTTKLLGHFNLLNIKAATSILRHINISETVIQKNLSSCSPPRGCNVYPN